MRAGWAWALLAAALIGCGDADHGAAPDAGDGAVTDGAVTDGGTTADVLLLPVPLAPMPPAQPVLTPCPAGWREVSASHCDPWPAGGQLTCPAGMAHFPGETGCSRVGSACPTGNFAPAPAGAVLYVRRGATGGTGTIAAPFGTIAQAMQAATAGTTILLDKSAFTEGVTAKAGVKLLGACTAATSIAAPGNTVTVPVMSGRFGVANLTLAGGGGATFVAAGATLDLDDVVISGATRIGMGVFGTLGATRVVVENMIADAVGDGIPLSVQDGTATLAKVVLTGAPAETIYALGAATRLSLTDVAIVSSRRTGLRLEPGTVTTLRRVVIERGMAAAISVNQGNLDASDLVVDQHGVAPSLSSTIALTQARADLARTRITRSAGQAISSGQSTTVLRDVVIDTTGHHGIRLAGGSLTADRLRLDRTANRAIIATGQAQATLRDLVVKDVAFGMDGVAAALWILDLGTLVTIERTSMAGAADVAILVATMGALRLSDGRFANIRNGPSNSGYALAALTETRVTIDRMVSESPGVVGILATNNAEITATDLVITDAREPDCAGSTCPDYLGMGVGVGAYNGAHMSITGFTLAANKLCGVSIDATSTMDLQRGVIRDQPVGANVQNAGFDLARIANGVFYLNNTVGVDSRTLPPPPFVAALPP